MTKQESGPIGEPCRIHAQARWPPPLHVPQHTVIFLFFMLICSILILLNNHHNKTQNMDAIDEPLQILQDTHVLALHKKGQAVCVGKR